MSKYIKSYFSDISDERLEHIEHVRLYNFAKLYTPLVITGVTASFVIHLYDRQYYVHNLYGDTGGLIIFLFIFFYNLPVYMYKTIDLIKFLLSEILVLILAILTGVAVPTLILQADFINQNSLLAYSLCTLVTTAFAIIFSLFIQKSGTHEFVKPSDIKAMTFDQILHYVICLSGFVIILISTIYVITK